MAETESREIEITKEDDFQTDLGQKYPIFKVVDPFFNRINGWFDDYWWPFETRIRLPLSKEKSKFRVPLINITEESKKYQIDVELPGINKEDIDISIIDDILEIKGENKKESKKEEKGFIRREYQSSSYFRIFKLPNNVDKDNIEADMKNGRLEISLPIKETEKKEKKTVKIK